LPIAKHVNAAIRLLAPTVGELVETGALIAGAALVAYGAFEIYRPAGPITAGVLLIAGILLRARGNG
jgi:hypothetical protein